MRAVGKTFNTPRLNPLFSKVKNTGYFKNICYMNGAFLKIMLYKYQG